MKKNTSYFHLTFLVLICFFASFAQTRNRQSLRAQTDQEEIQSRELTPDVWLNKRKPSKVQVKHRRYKRVGVSNSSAMAQVRKSKPNTSGNGRLKVPKPTVTWQDVVLDKSEQVGVTIWRLRKCTAKSPQCFLRLHDKNGRIVNYEALRVNTDTDFQVGDGIQLGIESPVSGYIYIIHQEVYENGKIGEPKLLYPLREGVNAVTPGRPLLIPTQGNDGEVKVLKMRNDEGKDLKAERLKIIITPKPIEDIFVKENPRNIIDSDLDLWESKWSGRLELFDLDGGEKEAMSLNEWYAMQSDNNGSRDLTTEDLAPQRLYVVERKGISGVLVTIDLPYSEFK